MDIHFVVPRHRRESMTVFVSDQARLTQAISTKTARASTPAKTRCTYLNKVEHGGPLGEDDALAVGSSTAHALHLLHECPQLAGPAPVLGQLMCPLLLTRTQRATIALIDEHSLDAGIGSVISVTKSWVDCFMFSCRMKHEIRCTQHRTITPSSNRLCIKQHPKRRQHIHASLSQGIAGELRTCAWSLWRRTIWSTRSSNRHTGQKCRLRPKLKQSSNITNSRQEVEFHGQAARKNSSIVLKQ